MNLTFLVVLALIASVGAFSVSGGRRSFMTMVKAGEAAPDFELKTSAGKTIKYVYYVKL